MLSRLADRLKRVTTTGVYISEIDGLRFIASLAVFLLHTLTIWTTLVGRTYETMSGLDDLLYKMVMLGGYGVELFFMISGFVLAMPFYRHGFEDADPVSLKKYFWRRVTRLEPPYIITMIAFYLLRPLWGNTTYTELFPHLAASFAYLHNAIYNMGSTINSSAWSLEVEIQFYFLVPFILKAIAINSISRRFLIIYTVVFFSLHGLWLPKTFPASILQYFQYFVFGVFICDLWTMKWKHKCKTFLSDLPGLIAWPSFFFINLTFGGLTADICNPWLIAGLFYSAIRGKLHSSVLSWKVIPVIGCMCYSIYLLHSPMLSLFLRYACNKFQLTGAFSSDFTIITFMAIPFVLAISTMFYLFIEKPCMNPKWLNQLLSNLSSYRSMSISRPIDTLQEQDK